MLFNLINKGCVPFVSCFPPPYFRMKNKRGLSPISPYFPSPISPSLFPYFLKAIRRKVRSWSWQLRSGDTLEDLARECNPIIRGWINYYGRFNSSAMFGILDLLII